MFDKELHYRYLLAVFLREQYTTHVIATITIIVRGTHSAPTIGPTTIAIARNKTKLYR